MKHSIFQLAVAFGVAAWSLSAAAWQPAPAQLMTEWGAKVTPQNAWRQYPRPEMQRGGWQCLNGEWDFGVGKWAQDELPRCDRKILVPFAAESPLSGVGRPVDPDEVMVYRRNFTLAKTAGVRTLLNFESVDYRAQVFVNGIEVTDSPHEGYSLPFAVDATAAVKAGENALEVVVWDPTNEGDQAVGKQLLKPEQCFYTRCSGIIGTVWLEQVPMTYVTRYVAVPNVDDNSVAVTVEIANFGADTRCMVTAMDGEQVLASGEVTRSGATATLKLPKEIELWNPGAPRLYDLVIAVRDGAAKDTVRGYFGMRKVERKRDAKGRPAVFVNGKKTYLLGPLDQGWWPDGLLTPPSEAAMRYDLETELKVGYNTVRKHIKIEPRRFYYDCDRLGMMVMQDMPCGYAIPAKPNPNPWVDDNDQFRQRRYAEYRRELKGMVDLLGSHPSIVAWVAYNECWGAQNKPFAVMTFDWLKRYDPTRLVDISGWWDWWQGGQRFPGDPFGRTNVVDAVTVTDFYDRHNYALIPNVAIVPESSERIAFLGEYGGLSLSVPGHVWKHGADFEYTALSNRVELLAKYTEQAEQIVRLAAAGLGGSIYTQITDVENERNGVMTYDRKLIKYDLEALKRLHRRIYDAAEE